MRSLHEHLSREEHWDRWCERCENRALAIMAEGGAELQDWRERYQEHQEASRDVPQIPTDSELVQWIEQTLTEDIPDPDDGRPDNPADDC